MTAFQGEEIDTVYIGGGTPSLMEEYEIKKVLNTVFNTFSAAPNTEITLEVNPMSVGGEGRLEMFKNVGINRLSIGVQSFSDAELAALGRGHSANDAVDTLRAARNYFDNVSLDLMLAIPHQTLESLESTLDTAILLAPEHISVYALAIEEKTVFGVKRKRGEELFLPDEDIEAQMYFIACQRLENAGYEHYEISNFAREGCRSRHNMKYWHGEEYIGLGASAHSYYKGERYSLPASIAGFCDSPEKLNSYTNTLNDRAEEFIFLSLRLKDGLDLSRLEAEHGITVNERLSAYIDTLAANGMCTFDGKVLALTDKGFFVSNTIMAEIMCRV